MQKSQFHNGKGTNSVFYILTLMVSLFTVFFSPSTIAVEFNKSTQVSEGLAASYGYVLAQDLAIARVQEEFPDLKYRATSVRTQYLLKFPSADYMRSTLKKVVGDEMLALVEEQMLPQLHSQVSEQSFTIEDAEQFLDLVERRSRGEIEEPILDWLLAANYLNNPSAEVRAGFTQKFESKPHTKSQGIDLSLKVPASWKAKEGDRPHVVQKWVSHVGHGLQLLMLLVIDTEGYTPTDAEFQSEISEGLAKEILPPGYKLKDFEPVRLENRTALKMRLFGQEQRLDTVIQSQATWYVLFYRGKMIMIQCSAMGLNGNMEQLDQDGVVTDALCRTFANSLVLNTEYP